MPITANDLQALVGKEIDDICTNGYSTRAQSHCAHFVSHGLGIRIGLLCGDMGASAKTRHTGASIRCDELYNGLTRKGPWEDRPKIDDGLLIFVISARNLVNGVMRGVSEKHVGVHFGGKVYNFSNGRHEVVCDATVESFHAKFKSSYHGGDISLFYGVAT